MCAFKRKRDNGFAVCNRPPDQTTTQIPVKSFEYWYLLGSVPIKRFKNRQRSHANFLFPLEPVLTARKKWNTLWNVSVLSKLSFSSAWSSNTWWMCQFLPSDACVVNLPQTHFSPLWLKEVFSSSSFYPPSIYIYQSSLFVLCVCVSYYTVLFAVAFRDNSLREASVLFTPSAQL